MLNSPNPVCIYQYLLYIRAIPLKGCMCVRVCVCKKRKRGSEVGVGRHTFNLEDGPRITNSDLPIRSLQYKKSILVVGLLKAPSYPPFPRIFFNGIAPIKPLSIYT